jgi:hypothetical protein
VCAGWLSMNSLSLGVNIVVLKWAFLDMVLNVYFFDPSFYSGFLLIAIDFIFPYLLGNRIFRT